MEKLINIYKNFKKNVRKTLDIEKLKLFSTNFKIFKSRKDGVLWHS